MNLFGKILNTRGLIANAITRPMPGLTDLPAEEVNRLINLVRGGSSLNEITRDWENRGGHSRTFDLIAHMGSREELVDMLRTHSPNSFEQLNGSNSDIDTAEREQ